ncbi:TonB-dependent receptor [Aquimarina mytili]|uniref:TonB-dependent receptor n=1 Tax=Aquimarina mytili TaxID=874423 RepID=A0A937A1I8_9FLAO|nr:TonB-dependent receptor [Aquimarina mytili]MBL0682714.1 TonB-dependent receptor [Aquimarina mytili]
MAIKLLCYIFFLCFSAIAFCQDLGQIGKAKLFKLTGGVAANAIFYEGQSNREPFTYFVNGNVNLNISGVYNIPFSFSYSNQEFQNNNPFTFNRLSIHPSYKWVTAHIGDVNMTFSPYTLSGHQFTGLGVDLTPKSPFRISAMYGRLLKKIEFNPNDQQSLAAFERIGYGFKTGYEFDKFSIAAIFFKAVDDKNSLENPVPVELELQPKENVVISLEGRAKLFDKGEISLEVASSAITEDLNVEGGEENSVMLSPLLQTNSTTQQFKAYNAKLSYPVAQGTVGVSYEYIDPDYRTLGAYFFNNDLENIAINATQNIFENKVNVSFNAGLQRDDLDNTKSTQLQRVVSAINVGYNASEKLTLSGGYSNFQSYTNIKNQFDFINEVSQFDNLDTLDFQQTSQNANLNANYILKDTETQKRNLNIALSFQNAVNKQGGQTIENGDSNFYNGSASYTIGYPATNLNISTSVNVSYSTIGVDNSLTYGPIVSANKQFFDKKLRTTASLSYNQSNANSEKQGEVTNVRLSGTYVYLKRHNFNLNVLSQFRNSTNSTQDFTVTFGYNYTFDKFNPKFKFPKRKGRKEKTKKDKNSNEEQRVHFKYRDSLYQGTLAEVNIQLENLQNHPHFDHIPGYKKGELTMLRQIVADQKEAKEYKPKAIIFLRELYSYEDFLAGYNQLVFETLIELRRDMLRLDYAFEKAFVKAKVAVDNHELHPKIEEQRNLSDQVLRNQYKNLQENSDNALGRLIGHRWMLPIIKSYRTIEKIEKPDKYLSQLMEQEKENIFRMKDQKNDDQKIKLYLITQIIDFYLKESLKHTDPDKFELKYIEKN